MTDTDPSDSDTSIDIGSAVRERLKALRNGEFAAKKFTAGEIRTVALEFLELIAHPSTDTDLAE